MKNFSHTMPISKRRIFRTLIIVAAASSLIVTPKAHAAGDLAGLSIEELMNIEITSVSKKPERASDAPAAVTVITGEDIRRAGYSTIPDALRLVPGLEVAQIDLNTWAITSRGFNGQFASKLLVLIDGRSVYSPLSSGVIWDAQDLLMEDVDRIEVIRGPGATLWGANAVNGVINIITKDAESTQGSLVSAGGGTAERYGFNARYGGTAGNRFAYRVYAKSFDRFQEADATTSGADDKWQSTRLGFRLDGPLTTRSNLTIQGETYSGISGYAARFNSITPPYNTLSVGNNVMTGGHLLADYHANLSPTSKLRFAGYADRLDADVQATGDHRTNANIEMQHDFLAGSRHEFVWGMGYRYSWDHLYSSPVVTFTHDRTETHLLNLFVQDKLHLSPEHAWLTLGSKAEHNPFTGYEVQPNARLTFAPHHDYRLWSAVSRAVRTPSRGEVGSETTLMLLPPLSEQNPGPLPVLVNVYGNEDMKSEAMMAYELGARANPWPTLAMSISTFYHDFQRLRSAELLSSIIHMDPPAPYVEVPTFVNTNFKGYVYGAELEADVQPMSTWRLHGYYTFLSADIKDSFSDQQLSSQPTFTLTENAIPKHQVVLRSAWNPAAKFELDIIGRFVDKLTNTDIPAYATADCRAGYEVFDGFQLFAAGQNLIGPAHIEFDSPLPLQTLSAQTERTIYVGANWKFQHKNRKVQISKR